MLQKNLHKKIMEDILNRGSKIMGKHLENRGNKSGKVDSVEITSRCGCVTKSVAITTRYAS